MGELNPSSGSSASGFGTDTLTLTTNCSSGYYIYASATSGGSTAMSGSNGGTISASSNAMGSANTLNDNTWGLTSSLTEKNASKFSGLPTYANATKTALYTGSSSASSAQIPVYYGVKVNSSLTPGTYTGNVLYTALVKSECYTYTVNFNGNGGTTSSSATSTTQEINRDTETALTSNPFTRDGYNFLGWATSEANATAKTVAYEDEAKVTNLAEANSSITLWAVWEEAVTYMQNWTGCDSLSANEVVELVDSRNNVTYKVKKIVNTSTNYSECWMVENLRLTPGTTDPGTTAVTSGVLTLATDTSQAAGSVTFSDSGFNNSTAGTTGLRAVYKGNVAYGAYYTWSAAKVVCPAGWHLPTGGSGGDFANLDIALGGTGSSRTISNTYSLFTNALDNATTPGLAFPLAGIYDGSSLGQFESYGYYWSSTQDNSSRGHYLILYLGNSYVGPQDNAVKSFGHSVRCVAGKAPYSIAYNANGGTGAATTTGEFAGAASAKPGTKITLATNGTLTKSGYTFQGWGLSSSTTTISYAGGEKLIPINTLASKTSTAEGGTITLYAVWKKNPTNYTTESTCTSAGGKFLKDNKCWKISDTTATWANRDTICTGNWTVPSPGDYDALVVAYGSVDYSGTRRNGKRDGDNDLYTALDLSADTIFWSSQVVASNTAYAFILYVLSSYSVSNGNGVKTYSNRVLCLAS